MGYLMWYEWNNLESFNIWHTHICLSLGIPNEQTLDYTKPVQAENKIIAVVNLSEANGLTPTDLRPVRTIGENIVETQTF